MNCGGKEESGCAFSPGIGDYPVRRAAQPATSSDLRRVAQDLARALKGYPSGNGFLCRCPAHDDRHPSLSIRIGRSALLFKCFAGCDTREVLRELRDIDARAVDSRVAPISPDTVNSEGGSRETFLRARARDIWDRSRATEGTPVAAYLAARSLHGTSPALRFNGRTPLGAGEDVTYRPALIAALHEEERLVAVQRCFLDVPAHHLARDLSNPRRLLGRPGGGAVVLLPATGVLGLAEGIETALSAARLLNIPVWATLGAERLPRIRLPDHVSRLVLLPDRDRSGRIGAAKAAQAYARDNRCVETAWPPAGFNDWNDALRANAVIASCA
jgi:putative DNA primase/helicase